MIKRLIIKMLGFKPVTLLELQAVINQANKIEKCLTRRVERLEIGLNDIGKKLEVTISGTERLERKIHTLSLVKVEQDIKTKVKL